MTIHWPTAKEDPQARIAAVQAAWWKGCSMGQLGAMLGTTRSAISGVYGRHPELRTSHPLRPASVRGATFVSGIPRPPKPLPVLTPAGESHGAGRTLQMLQAHQCKWPVNDAGSGELHLFCALPAEGPYCQHHKRRSTATSIGWGFR
jgi:hypothetical protein